MWLYIIHLLILIPLFPYVFIKGAIIQRRLKDLTEAKVNKGVSGNKYSNTKRLLIIGESSMAGIGILKHENAFAGILAKQLEETYKCNIQWEVHAKRGYTVKQIRNDLLPKINSDYFDLIIIGIGANDAFELTSPIKWSNYLKTFIQDLSKKFKTAPILFLNMPPIKLFPAFDPVMHLIFGNILKILSNNLNLIVKDYPNVYYNNDEIDLKKWITKYNTPINSKEYFIDGVHPSSLTYKLWAKETIEFITDKEIVKDFDSIN